MIQCIDRNRLCFLNMPQRRNKIRSTDKKKRATRFDKQDLFLLLVFQNTDLFRNFNFAPFFFAEAKFS